MVNSRLIPARKKQMSVVESYQQMRHFNNNNSNNNPLGQQMAECTTQARVEESSLD